MKDRKNMVLMFVIVIVTAGVGFYGGIMFQKSKTSKPIQNCFVTGDFGHGARSQLPVPGAGGRMAGGKLRPIVGEILSKDDKSITVKLRDGSSRIIMLSSTTNINRAEKVDPSALIEGETVRVFGTINPDGSVTAQDIQLNPDQFGQSK